MILEHGLLAVGGERGFAEVVVGKFGGFAATRGAFDEAFLDEVGFVHILDRTCVFTHSGSNGVESDRTSTELINDGQQQFIIYLIETESIDIECLEGILGYLEIDLTVALDLREIAHTAQESIRDTRRSSGTTGYLTGGFLVDLDA